MVMSATRSDRRELYAVRTPSMTPVPSSASSDKSLRNRNLDNYPMDHSHTETLHCLSQRKQVNVQGRLTIKRAGLASQNLSKHSKLLFDDAIQEVTRPAPPPSSTLPKLDNRRSTDTASPSYGIRSGLNSRASSAMHSGSNGPTLAGSPIYKSRPLFLTSLTPDQERSPSLANQPKDVTLTPYMQMKLQQSNRAYRVVSSAAGSRVGSAGLSTPTFQDYILVPAGEDPTTGNDVRVEDALSFGDPEETSTMINAVTNDLVINAKSDISLRTGDSLLGAHATLHPDTEVTNTAQNEELCDNETSDPLQPEEQPKEDDKQGPARNSYRSRSEKSRRKVTWVDDATVSSPNPATDDQETRDQPIESCDQLEDKPSDKELTQNCAKNEADISDQNQVLNLSDIQAECATLPDFICPSSEDKSREARTKHWLNSNNFTWASRSVPLL